MRMSELSTTADLPVATVKYYLREGLLPPGRPLAPTRADYDDRHVARLRLIRALVEVAGLPLATVRGVLAALDADSLPAAIGAAHEALSPAATETEPRQAIELLTGLGWKFQPGSGSLHQLEAAIAGLVAADLESSPAHLSRYADAALTLARDEIAAIPGPAEDAVRYVVLGTVLYEPVLLALRRLAEQHAYAEQASP